MIKQFIVMSEKYDKIGKHSISDRLIILASLEINIGNLIPEKLNLIFNEVGADLLAVGGSIRDALLGQSPKDIDLCTNLKPDEVIELCENNGLKVLPLGLSHGTVSVVLDGELFEITTFRFDRDTDGRHATVEFTDNIIEDLSRRDFTCNAIAADSYGNIIDPFNGRKDLANGIIRAVGDPKKRFTEDFLRIIRAARFASRYGFSIEDKTREAMEDLAPVLCKELNIDERGGAIAMERLVDEFNKAFKTNKSSQFLNIMNGLGIIQTVIPELIPNFSNITINIDKVNENEKWQTMFMWLAPSNVESVIRRLKMPLDILKSAKKICEMKIIFENLINIDISDFQIREFQINCGDQFGVISSLFNKIYSNNINKTKLLTPLHEQFKTIIQGRDILDLFPDRKPGPWVGDILRDITSFHKHFFNTNGINPTKKQLIEFIKGKNYE